MVYYFKKAALQIFFILIAQSAQAQTASRFIQDITPNAWKLWLDTAANWQNDKLYPPPINLAALPVNPPSGGWGILKSAGIPVKLPATVEEYYWGRNGNSYGVGGNYLGVSWFTTSFNVPADQKGKRIVLNFESVRLRAEIFVNQKLVGYDLVNSTPFEVDITKATIPGKANELAVRITDPDGNFDWRDSQNFMWGNYRIQPTHGFGGITGSVKLIATGNVFVRDVFIKNKPDLAEVDVQVTMENNNEQLVSGNVSFQVKENKTGKQVYQKDYVFEALPLQQTEKIFVLHVDGVKPWSVENPELYSLMVTWKGKDASTDAVNKRFGFRWFEVRTVNGDKQYYLNNKRIVLRSSISWGFWPENGIAPSDALARKQVEDAKKLGLNMLNFHRTIGQTNVLDYADELGLLYFEEPGGNQYPANRFNPTDSLGKVQRDFYFACRNEKFFRMIRRDRSHPSLVIYNMHNERGADPLPEDKAQMRRGHTLDATRIMTYNSCNGNIKMGPDPHFKLHLLPNDTVFYDYGWFDQHHAGGPGTYHNNLYNSPKNYLRYTDHKDEIIYYGEEGAIGTPPRLQLIRDQIMKRGKNIGWETDAYLKWYDVYDAYLKKHGFAKAFPNVDSLTRKMGNVAYYYQGRTIESIRMNNIVDGYAVNGWESMKLENHSGIVDNYRNLKGDASLIAVYNKPIYVAVKLNRKVLAVGDTVTADLFLVNELDVKGDHVLSVKATDSKKNVVWNKTVNVKIEGGTTYGQLLSSGNLFAPATEGYTTISAELKDSEGMVAAGKDELFAVKLNTEGMPASGMVADTTGVLSNFLNAAGIRSFKPFKSGRPEGNYLLVGAFKPQQTGNPLVTDILEWVNEGNTLIVVSNIEQWADHLARKEVIEYRGSKVLGTTWYGGNYFSKQHPLFNGLPQACVFNWEYQCFATYNRQRMGLRLFSGDPVVACVADHKQEVYSALSVVPHGRGKIILCALDIISCTKDIKVEKREEGDGENEAMSTFNSSQSNKANVVGQQLLLNMLKFAKK